MCKLQFKDFDGILYAESKILKDIQNSFYIVDIILRLS